MIRTVLGLETSCDETAAALYCDGKILADRTTRQILHEQYGGVVPELASRAHEKLLMPAVEGVLKDAEMKIDEIDGISVTSGPGLAGALLVGVSFAKGLAQALDKPLIGVNHLEGHIWSAELTAGKLPLPFLALVVSGGHTLLVEISDFGRYKVIGSTVDDAAGELFDKVGRMIGFQFPAGPALDKAALDNSGDFVSFSRARLDNPLNFSFSGLKTAVLYYLRKNFKQENGFYLLSESDRSTLAAGIMETVADSLITNLKTAIVQVKTQCIVFAGGVSASKYLRGKIKNFCNAEGIRLIIPPIQHCTDNGSMIAYAGYRRFAMGESSDAALEINPAAKLPTAIN